MTGPVVYVVEDEEAFVEALTIGLEREGFVVETAGDGQEAVDRFDEVQPDVVLLDLMLPRKSGIDVCREIRKRSSVPIIMVTARTSEVDTVVGLEVGADDYVAKPYRMSELVARIRAVLRRAPTVPEPSAARASTAAGRLAVGDVAVDLDRHECTVRGELVPLPLKEFMLLTLLLDHCGRVLTRETLIARVWGIDYIGDTKTLDVHVKRLRGRIETDPANPVRILTVRGVGYKYVDVGRAPE